jgi:serine/threonine-protein kinase
MAEVYLAEQLQLKRRVAVKVLKPERAEDETYLKRFEREAQAAASLVHANIVQIYEVGHSGKLHYIAQEYVQGQDLGQWLARNGPPTLSQALAIIRQVAAALARAAEQGVVHRDIKPENIMLTSSGEVKVADFGLARVPHEEAELTQVGMTMGTPLYMSPEQIEGRLLDPRSDIYSLGVTCYHLLAGKPPFSGETSLAVAVQHLKKQPGPLEIERGDLPPALCRVVHKMLAKDPDQRWQSAREVLAELCRIRMEYRDEATPEDLAEWESLGLTPPSDSRVRARRRLDELMKSAAPPRVGRRAKWLIGLCMAAALVLGGAAAWVTVHGRPLGSAGQGSTLRVPRQATALRQWYYASQVGTVDSWRAVIEYFDNAYLSNRARQHLARIYLREKNYDQALKALDELAAADDADREFQAFGLAGKCVALCLQGKYHESAQVLDELWPIKQNLKDSQMNAMLIRAMRDNPALSVGRRPAKSGGNG